MPAEAEAKRSRTPSAESGPGTSQKPSMLLRLHTLLTNPELRAGLAILLTPERTRFAGGSEERILPACWAARCHRDSPSKKERYPVLPNAVIAGSKGGGVQLAGSAAVYFVYDLASPGIDWLGP